MNRSIACLLALAVGSATSATAGELEDCYNSESSDAMELTGAEPEALPEVLQVTDADLAALLMRLREHEEQQAVATAQPRDDDGLRVELSRK